MYEAVAKVLRYLEERVDDPDFASAWTVTGVG